MVIRIIKHILIITFLFVFHEIQVVQAMEAPKLKPQGEKVTQTQEAKG